ncbi:MAG: zf-HC2 domain-containing protein [Oscillospiraceae bacterium]|nr:zf-HC2 domain-containing protein [Oscillospiraceae bacterium]
MIGCEYYQELISQLIDGELTKDEESELAEHLQNCPECAAMHRAFAELSAIMEEDMEDSPEMLCPNVMAELRRAEILKKNRRKSAIKALFATAACAVFVIAAGRLSSFNGTESAVTGSTNAAAFDTAVVAESKAFAVPADAPAEAVPETAMITAAAPAAPAPMPETEESADMSINSFSLKQADIAMDAGAGTLETLEWLHISEKLNGQPMEGEPQLPDSPALNLTVFNEGVYYTLNIYQLEDSICYIDPLDGVLKQSFSDIETLANS